MLKSNSLILSLVVVYLATIEKLSKAISVRDDDLRVPYVPHVVLNGTDKNDFNYDNLQEIISRYLEAAANNNNNYPTTGTTTTFAQNTTVGNGTLIEESAAHGTNLFNYLKTTSNSGNDENQSNEFDRQLQNIRNVYNYYGTNLLKSNYLNNNISLVGLVRPTGGGSSGINNNNGRKQQLLNISPTTYRPYQVTENKERDVYSRPSAIPVRGGTLGNFKKSRNKHSYSRQKNWSTKPTTAITAYQDNAIAFSQAGKGSWVQPSRYSDLTCNIKSVRYIRSGDCISKKPIFESVCAEKCVEYDPKMLKKKYGIKSRKQQSHILAVQYYPSQALDCIDGDTRKIGVNLYCKDGTVKNSIIRVVKDCICMKHSNLLNEAARKISSKIANPPPKFGYKYY